MSGKEDEAVEMLRKAYEDAEKQGKIHEAYELEMLLVEMLIYKVYSYIFHLFIRYSGHDKIKLCKN